MNSEHQHPAYEHQTESAKGKTVTVSIGKQLFQARTHKGLSLSEVAEATKLKMSFLEAMENDNFEVLPAAIYAKNFIRIYGQYLGLDGQEMARLYGSRVIIKTELPEKEEVSQAYYVATIINFIIRHKFLSILTIVFVIILYSIFSGSSSEPKQNGTTVSGSTADLEARNTVAAYPAVTDMDEPLPELE